MEENVGRRSSSRIKKLMENRKTNIEDNGQLSDDDNEQMRNRKRKEKAQVNRKRKEKVVVNDVDGKKDVKSDIDVKKDDDDVVVDLCEGESGSEVVDWKEMVISDRSSVEQAKGAHAKVMQTLRIYNKYYLHFIQEEDLRAKRVEAELEKRKKALTKPTKKGDAGADDLKRSSKRPDLKAVTKMRETGTILYTEKRPGDLPGVDVGHRFYSRAEMVAVGLHSHWLNGIDFMGESFKKLDKFKHLDFPVAVSIVLSGQYEDDLDNSEKVVYTGQGGHDLLGNKRQIGDQVMKSGNLALKNNIEKGVPVRVIRGHKCSSSYAGKVYTYDGLYKVVKYWAEKGAAGFTIFKYGLERLKDQAPLTTNQVQFYRAQVPQSLSEIRGLVCEDISGGQEDVPIRATNLVDEPPVAPVGFTYIKSNLVAESVRLPTNATGCNCRGSCTDPRTCSCAKLNGSDFPYVAKDGGRLIEVKPVVFECGPSCGCGPECVNRTSQRGLKYQLEVFRTPSKGWAVRSWDFIPSGAPICEYIGRLMRTDELDNVSENNYIFEIDCEQTMKGLEKRQGNVSILPGTHLDEADDKKSDCEYCIDAGSIGNVARFINHSCEPNLFVQCVLSSHHDFKLARVVLVAADNIPPLQELTYDYGYALGSVSDKDGNIIQSPCYCGAAECRKRLY